MSEFNSSLQAHRPGNESPHIINPRHQLQNPPKLKPKQQSGGVPKVHKRHTHTHTRAQAKPSQQKLKPPPKKKSQPPHNPNPRAEASATQGSDPHLACGTREGKSRLLAEPAFDTRKIKNQAFWSQDLARIPKKSMGFSLHLVF